MKKIIILLFVLSGYFSLQAQYKIGDAIKDFRLKNTKGEMVSLKNFKNAKGFIIIFSCNHCPWVKLYEDRMIALHKKYAPLGYPVIAINSNDPNLVPADSFEKMQERANEKGFPFDYCVDDNQEMLPLFGATRTPEVFLLTKKGKNFALAYTGAIDDNSKNPEQVTQPYVSLAIDELLMGFKPKITQTKAVGCSIKVEKK